MDVQCVVVMLFTPRPSFAPTEYIYGICTRGTMNGIPSDVFNHHIMPAACENQTLRAELTRVRTALESETSMNMYLKFDLMRHFCTLADKLWYHDIYGLGDMDNNYGKPTRGIDDFRINIVGGETLKEYRVFKMVESSVPTEEQVMKILNHFGAQLTDISAVQILTAEERQAELINMHNGEDDKAFTRPELIHCMDFMYVD